MRLQKDLLIFDLGNVLFEIDFSNAFRIWSQETGIPTRVFAQRFQFDEIYESFEVGRVSAEQYFSHLNQVFGTDMSIAQLTYGWNSIYGPVIAPNHKIILKLAERHIAVALTNTNPVHKISWQKRYKSYLEVFQQIFISSDLGMRKPEHEIFQHILTAFDKDVGSSVFFDDNIDNVESAARMGIESILVLNPTSIEEWLATAC